MVALVDPLEPLLLPPSPRFLLRCQPVAPGGQPPLVFVLDMVTVVGTACVPIGLTYLGSVLSEIKKTGSN